MPRYLLVLDRDLVTADEQSSPGRSTSGLARLLPVDPVHRLRLRLRHRLTVFPLGAAAPQLAPVS